MMVTPRWAAHSSRLAAAKGSARNRAELDAEYRQIQPTTQFEKPDTLTSFRNLVIHFTQVDGESSKANCLGVGVGIGVGIKKVLFGIPGLGSPARREIQVVVLDSGIISGQGRNTDIAQFRIRGNHCVPGEKPRPGGAVLGESARFGAQWLKESYFLAEVRLSQSW
jgi:hypothetical protein